MTPAEKINITSNLGQQVVSNLFMAQRYAQANREMNWRMEQAQKEMSLRDRAYEEGKRQFDLSYKLQNDQFDMTRKVQDAQLKQYERQATDWEAETEAAPYITSFESDLRNLYGDPEAIQQYSPDLSFIDKAPENIRPRLKAKVSAALGQLKDKYYADSDELKDTRERGALLLKGSKYLTAENGYTPDSYSLGKQLGRKLLKREELSPEEDALASSLASKVEFEARKRDPALIKEQYKQTGELKIEALRTANTEYSEASRNYRQLASQPGVLASVKEEAKLDLEKARKNLQIAQKLAGLPFSLPQENEEETQPTETKAGTTPAPNAGNGSPLRRALPMQSYPPTPSKFKKDNSMRGSVNLTPEG